MTSIYLTPYIFVVVANTFGWYSSHRWYLSQPRRARLRALLYS